MTEQDRIKELKARFAAVKTWKKRCKRLNKRKKDPLSDLQFCQKYDLPASWFNRNKNGTAPTPPKQASIIKVENAFISEGV